MTEIEKLAKAIFVDYRSSDPCEGSTWNSVDPEAKAQTIHVVRVVLQHLHDNVTEGMVEAMDEAPAEYRAEFQAAIASILADAPSSSSPSPSPSWAWSSSPRGCCFYCTSLSTKDAEAIVGLSYVHSDALFYPPGGPAYNANTSQAVAVLALYLATGLIDWSIPFAE